MMKDPAPKDTTPLGMYVWGWRRKHSMTQTDLAARSGVSYATISRIERGEMKNPHRSTLVALAVALDRPPDELLQQLPHGGER